MSASRSFAGFFDILIILMLSNFNNLVTILFRSYLAL